MALPHYCSPGTPRSSSHDAGPSNGIRRSSSVGDDDAQSQAEENDPVGGTFQSGKWYGNCALGSVAPASVLEPVRSFKLCAGGHVNQYDLQLKNVGISLDERGVHISPRPVDARNIDLMQASSTMHASSAAGKLLAEDLEWSAVESLESLVHECGVTPHKISELLQELPPIRFSEALIDFYFQNMYVATCCMSYSIQRLDPLAQKLDSLSCFRIGLSCRLSFSLCP